jgi:hypothetical protein
VRVCLCLCECVRVLVCVWEGRDTHKAHRRWRRHKSMSRRSGSRMGMCVCLCTDGAPECAGNIQQLCVREVYPDVADWFEFVLCQGKGCGPPSATARTDTHGACIQIGTESVPPYHTLSCTPTPTQALLLSPRLPSRTDTHTHIHTYIHTYIHTCR